MVIDDLAMHLPAWHDHRHLSRLDYLKEGRACMAHDHAGLTECEKELLHGKKRLELAMK
jgi:hypothetical protein